MKKFIESIFKTPYQSWTSRQECYFYLLLILILVAIAGLVMGSFYIIKKIIEHKQKKNGEKG